MRVCAGFDVDGLLVIRSVAGGGLEMRVFNADGSEAEMCGNGIRCVARYLAERGVGDDLVIATPAGPIETSIRAREPAFDISATVGRPVLGGRETIDALGSTWTYVPVDVGNPHIVLFDPDLKRVSFADLGAALATHARFLHGTNVHRAHVVDRTTIDAEHYERGVGLTQACGTGAVAIAVAAQAAGLVEYPVAVRVPGGVLGVSVTDGIATLSGPAETIGERTIASFV